MTAMAFVATASQCGVGQTQQWPVHNPPVENALPQYRSPANSTGNGSNLSGLPVDFFEPNQSNASEKNGGFSAYERGSDSSSPRSGQHGIVGPTERIQTIQPSSVSKTKSRERPKPNSKAKKISPPVWDESIFRDRTQYPIDVRKPCWQCGQGDNCQACSIGHKGRPYREKVYGGCECDSCKPWKHPNFSVHWPRPFSACLDDRHPERAAQRYDACPDKRIVDVFDPLSKIKLSNYKRRDNGYCGPGSDPYGCLGESKLH